MWNMLENYVDSLNPSSLARYIEKTKLIDGADPYRIMKDQWSTDDKDLPDITYPDIVNYLVTTESSYTLEDLKDYRSLQSYNYFVSGWVSDVMHCTINDRSIIIAKVQRSLNVKAAPFLPWIITESNGVIRATHCNCITGLGETCSHVGAILFTVEAVVKVRQMASVVDESAYWLMSHNVQKIEFSKVQDINFESTETLKRKKNQNVTISPFPTVKSSNKVKVLEVAPPTEQEMAKFFRELHESNAKSAILSLIPEYCHFYGPCYLNGPLPKLLCDLYDENWTKMSKYELFDYCEKIMLSFAVTAEQADAIEKETRDHDSSKQWLIFRTGLITDSKLRTVYSDDIGQPSIYLLKSICYPKKVKPKQTNCDCNHLKLAHALYTETMKSQHQDFVIYKCGLIINPSWPFLTALPDYLTSCRCCGEGTLQLKCLCCNKPDELIDPPAVDNCFIKTENGQILLRQDHPIYYQIQAQVNISRKAYADIVVITSQFTHVERNQSNTRFWEIIIKKVIDYFRYIILPELTSKFYTRSNSKLAITDDQNKDFTGEEALLS
ncbi:hypothetical protein TrispH2_006575 [Trichoplax sp. H2]|nr:hypothetical protein TrispH2_006575 [Trichoplax sp. H2]|eukprot:RDD42711.1 hypothetical protein TrispH2_006575 [Trichoplax sp. H2]